MQRKSLSQLRIRKQSRSSYYDENVIKKHNPDVDYHYDKSDKEVGLSGFEANDVIVRIHDDCQDPYVDNKVLRFE